MIEMPLFPLNTVLFPGMPLRLHIFEERYKTMIAYCRQSGSPFGVSLIERGEEVGETAVPHHIGCTAVITEVEPLADGRLNIVAIGQERFQILSLRHDQPYLVGVVERFPLENPLPDLLEDTSRALRSWVRRYLQVLAQASDSQFDLQQLPDDPLKLAHLASFLVQLPPAQKQQILAIPQADNLLKYLRAIYRREVTLLQAMLIPREEETEGAGPFSAN